MASTRKSESNAIFFLFPRFFVNLNGLYNSCLLIFTDYLALARIFFRINTDLCRLFWIRIFGVHENDDLFPSRGSLNPNTLYILQPLISCLCCRTPQGLEDVSSYPVLFAELIRSGKWSAEDLKKLAGQNFLRVMREVEKVR